MEYGEKYLEMMQTATGQDSEELFEAIISEVPLKNDIILLHEAMKKCAGCKYEMIFLNEPDNISVLTGGMIGREFIVRCDSPYNHEDIESNEMLAVMDDDVIILFDYLQYIESIRSLDLTDKQYRDILSFCIEHEVIDEGNAFYLKREFGEKRVKLYEANA